MRILVLLHGFGMRGFFFEPIKTLFESRFTQVLAPDLDMTSVENLIDSTKAYFENLKNNYPTSDIYVIGHSLGGIVASIIAQKLQSDVIKKAALISSPFGEQKMAFKGFTRFLIVHQLIPNFMSRPRFFSNQTPKSVQIRMWSHVVPESIEMIDELLAEKPFYLDQISELIQETLVIGSESDKVVSAEKVKLLAERIKATDLLIFDKKRNINHNDFITAPIIARELSEKITTFFLGEKNIWD